jgi:hypothetical protein
LDSDLGLQSFRELPPRWQDKLQKLHNDDADATKKSLIKAYTNWLMVQFSSRGGEPARDNPLQPYRDFRDLRNNYFTNQLESDVVKYFPRETVEQFRQWASADAGRRLDDYVASCNKWLSDETHFPVFLSSATPMTLLQVTLLKEELNQRANDIKEVLQNREGDQSPAFKIFTDRVSLMSQVVAALAPDAGRPVTRRMAAHPIPGDAANRCPYAHLTIGNQHARLDLSKHEAPIALADLAGSLEIKVTSRPDWDDRDAPVFYINRWETWGALQLITSPNVQFEGGKWIVPLAVKNSDSSNVGNVYIELEFDPPLPSLEQWRHLNLPTP